MKDLHNGNLYWPTTLSNNCSYPPLQLNARYRVAIVGGGISGLLCGYVLAKSGINTVILERGEVAGGSTSANTGLLQFCNDIMLTDLIEEIGEADAVQFYKACQKAVEQFGEIVDELNIGDGFARRSSLYYASTEEEVPKLKREYETLLANGFPVEYWEPDTIERHFPFRKPGAIVTHGDAEINPLLFVHALAEASTSLGLVIYEHTDITTHDTQDFGLHRLTAATGAVIEADHVIYAIGYEPEELRGQLIKADINRTYAIVTEPQRDIAPWHEQYLIWESARPYIYMRTTGDGRVIVGGLDENNSEPLHNDQQRHARTDKLLQQLQNLFPAFTAPIAYDWTASFGESRDNLPFIGKDPAWPGVYYCLGYGGNGSVYSMIASCLLRDLIRGDDHQLAHIVKLDRTTQLNRV
ncbi:Gamma-glutamylputrescine oxidoreductase [Paenibacillus plantiphilus]|uniref:Gamma-glutamylputrescine oxidoreductase n=1 Tax=Paenibacillus plantiphilus TaxID=2905650 RepID=A0ABM9CDK4_9BACL|nr:FAD-dependent oxidoreductase [Paenibacillus plantiphilus]CAH1210871.1 Gamma-glutamylputrescine oxidoreductase [Paenibacillus plantiphilus]